MPAPWCATAAAVLVAALVAASWPSAQAAAAADYDKACAELIRHAQLAARAFNAGDAAAAQAEKNEARVAFRTATKLAPGEPQAYADMATFLFNTHDFAESARAWDQAIQRVDDPRLRAQLGERKRQSHLGYYSVSRDAEYRNGQGDIRKAVEWTQKQLDLYRSPEFLFDLATMQVMLSNEEDSLATLALKNFHEAHNLAFVGFRAGRRVKTQAGGTPCADDSDVYYEWSLAPDVKSEHRTLSIQQYGRSVKAFNGKHFSAFGLVFRQRSIYVSEFADVQVSGNEGVLLDSKCNMYLAAPGPFIDVPRNVQLLATWMGGKGARWHDASKGKLREHGAVPPEVVRYIDKAAMIVQFASTSYYHFLTEALGRLLLLRPALEADPDLKLIVPKDTTGNGFITALLGLLPFQLDPERLVEYDTAGPNDVRLRVGRLYYANWNSVWHNKHPIFSVPPRDVLQAVRAALVDEAGVVEQRPGAGRAPVVVFISRAGESMRHLLQEGALLKSVQEALPRTAKLAVFNGKEQSMKATIRLFASADVVVGVHGGALANTVFCRPGALVVELGFRTSHHLHYGHLAMALDLQYEMHFLTPDQRGAGAASVTVQEETNAAVADTILRHLRKSGKHQEL